MWDRILDVSLRRFIREDALEITFADGTARRYGDPEAEPVRLTFRDPGLPRRILFNPEMALGEAYMDRRLTLGQDDLSGMFEVLLRNLRRSGAEPGPARFVKLAARQVQRFFAHNRITASRANVAHHYDLSSALYDLFLDEDRQYSCAYFHAPDLTLDAAQEAKKRHIAGKLLLRPGMRVLDIGCGWGGLALTLARDFGARVVGVTLSTEQHRIATDRVQAAGLSDRIDIRLMDYRPVKGPFDRVVSVGMFEHVGAPQYRTYFSKIRDLLTPDGVALVHTIGTSTQPRATGSWVRRYIFPGGYIPALSEAVAAIERERLVLTDAEVWRLHYAETLRHWAERFEARLDAARALFDDRFCRMWRYYLRAAEASFRHGEHVVFQLQLARAPAAVPLTRDYLYPAGAMSSSR